MSTIHDQSVAVSKPKISRVEVYWHTVKYRTVILYAVVITAIVFASTYLVFPDQSSKLLNALSDAIGRPDPGVAATLSARQARFVNLDGRVQVKKANSVQWVNADYQITLDKGDLIQTGSEGMARIAFADGTTYTVKGDTYVTVEENFVGQDRPTQVAVHMNSGQVDLRTGAWPVSGSKAEVSFENAVASARANSSMAVRSDPETNEQQVTVDSGSAELERGNERVDIGAFERATIPSGGGAIVKTQVLAPPELVAPLNLQPIIVADPKHDPIHFSWKSSPMAKLYDFQASTTTMFTHIVTERKTGETSVDITGLDPGDYFWRVRAIDGNNTASEPSDPYKFTLVAQGKEQEMLLEVDGTQLHGDVIEVMGRTEPGAALIINGEAVADIKSDGIFRYFTPVMARGSHEIVITGQNRRGGTAIKRVEVVIP
ncbi:MAG TPA: FecR domain-containing protein [Candidatus Acidoferrales bacterium]|nr:FecR domain-containing protein [Candidatus Acidoferrales bacterium]